ncbi:MAG: hypothetical protein M0P94_02270 [Candidatus Absconditabacterales bacterium]|nr:hypothetical protein [Candidatus Absconditabacterales bacterium]
MVNKIFGFMGAPGLGKTVAMNIAEHPENLKSLKETLGLEKDLTVDVVKKDTSRPNRGADDRLKNSGIPEQNFIDDKENYVGEYTLTNNNAKYAYHVDELNKKADVLVAEPSIHHLSAMKTHLQDRLVVVLIAADTEYRKIRMGGRGTEEESQINKRLIEGDVQLFIASKLSGEDGEILSKMIDPKGYEIYELIYSSGGDMKYLDNMKNYFMNLVGEEKFVNDASDEYFKMIINNTKKGDTEKLFDHIIVRSLEKDELAGDNFLIEGDFRDNIIGIIQEHLSK